MTASAFPAYPTVAPLPADLTEDERREFALALITEHGEALGDYLFAAVHHAGGYEAKMRWVEMTSLVENLHGGPIYLSYRACDRIAAETAEPLASDSLH